MAEERQPSRSEPRSRAVRGNVSSGVSEESHEEGMGPRDARPYAVECRGPGDARARQRPAALLRLRGRDRLEASKRLAAVDRDSATPPRSRGRRLHLHGPTARWPLRSGSHRPSGIAGWSPTTPRCTAAASRMVLPTSERNRRDSASNRPSLAIQSTRTAGRFGLPQIRATLSCVEVKQIAMVERNLGIYGLRDRAISHRPGPIVRAPPRTCRGRLPLPGGEDP